MSRVDLGIDAWLDVATDGGQLVELAMSRPQTVLSWCEAAMPRLVSRLGASYAWQARGLAAREVGDTTRAIRYIRHAVQFADRETSPERADDVRASLATTLAESGRGPEALAVFVESDRRNGHAPSPRVQMRRGAVLRMLGRREEALVALGAAIGSLRASGDLLWEARALSNRAIVHLDLGSPQRAERDLERARRLYAQTDQALEAAIAVHNLGWASYRLGAFPEALERLEAADALYVEAGARQPSLAMDRCAVLLAAGLADEAYKQIHDCIGTFASGDGRSAVEADALLIAARAALAAGRAGPAAGHAASAQRLYRRQGNDRAARLATLEGLRARWASGSTIRTQRRRAVALADELTVLGATEAVDARLLAGRIALGSGRGDAALVQLRLAAASRHRGPALARTRGWVAQLLAEEAAGSRSGVLLAARSGLRVLDTHRLSLGATELRAYASSHGTELVAGALRQVVADRDPRGLLAWSERWRALTVDAPPTRPTDAPDLLADLSELREVTRELTAGTVEGSTVEALTRRQRQLERAVLARSRQARGSAGPERGSPFDLTELFAALAGRQLVSLVEVDGTLYAILVQGDRIRRFRVGAAADAAREVEYTRFGLRTVLLGRGGPAAAGRLQAAAGLAEAALLGPVVAALDDSPLVLVPPTRLQATPWAALPALESRVFSLAPSARSWARSAAAAPPRRHRVVLVRGPGLASDGAEVPVLAGLHPGAVRLEGADATVAGTLAELDGAWLAHIAAHGSFRQDNPMFSALHLADGPLTLHDLERLRRTPHRIMLSACDAGLGASVGSDELLGLVNALMTLGSAGVLASVLPVSDADVVDLSVSVHGALLAGADLATALQQARRSSSGNTVSAATAAAFLAFGAA